MIHSKPSLTIFTDASIRKDTAGWAGWANGDHREQVTHSGPASWSQSSTVVELEAIAQMLIKLAQTQYLTQSDRSILIQSDSLNGLQVLRFVLPQSWPSNRDTGAPIGRPQRPIPLEKGWCDVIATLTSHCDVVYLRHVRAHKGGNTNRSWVNEICDKLAKEASRA